MRICKDLVESLWQSAMLCADDLHFLHHKADLGLLVDDELVDAIHLVNFE